MNVKGVDLFGITTACMQLGVRGRGVYRMQQGELRRHRGEDKVKKCSVQLKCLGCFFGTFSGRGTTTELFRTSTKPHPHPCNIECNKQTVFSHLWGIHFAVSSCQLFLVLVKLASAKGLDLIKMEGGGTEGGGIKGGVSVVICASLPSENLWDFRKSLHVI